MENISREKSNLIKAGFVLVVILTVYFATKIITEIKGFNFIGGGATASNVITFDGKGEVSAAPDMATISFTLTDDEKDLKTAQDKVTAKETAVLAFLDAQKIDKKDIKTESYNSYPKYDYGAQCWSAPCRPVQPTIIGYTVSEYISVKVHDLTQAGEIVKGIGAIGVNDMNGPNFSVEKEDEFKAQARKMAIDDAEAKAKVLAKDLGVKLVRIVNFSENGNYPMAYYGISKDTAMSATPASAPAPALPTGESKIISNVTITYEIR